jgi:DNA polymerase elongation subunit (family B)
MGEYDGDDAAGLDGRDSANIFDVQDVFENDPVAADGAEPIAVDDVDTDAFVPDDSLGAGDAKGALVRYRGEDWIEGVPTRADLVDRDAKMSEKIRGHLEEGRNVFFMPNDVEETNVYEGGLPTYSLRIFGVLMDGSKADVTLTGIEVFFDVRVPPGQDESSFEAHLRTVLFEADVKGARIRRVEAYPIRGYYTEPQPWRRVTTPNLQLRKRAIAAVRDRGFETASDDRSNYFRKLAREAGISLSDWAILRGPADSKSPADAYAYTRGPTDKSPLCAHVFQVPLGGYKSLVDSMAPKAQREKAGGVKARTPLLSKDRTLVVTWDIETTSARGPNYVPDATYDTDSVFMICLTAHWKDDPTPLAQVCIVDVETAPDARWATVVCGTQENVLRAFALVVRGLAPDVITGFNDSNYDWPFVVEKASRGKLLGWMFGQMSASPRRAATDAAVFEWNYRRDHRIKISAEEVFLSSYLKVPGSVPIDVRVCYKKLYPKSETPKAGSLKFYLEVSGLSGKADMPIARMQRIVKLARDVSAATASWTVEFARDVAARAVKLATVKPARAVGAVDAAWLESLQAAAGRLAAAAQVAAADRRLLERTAAELMRHVAHYCVLDALRCQQLLVRRNIINDAREVSSLAFVAFADSHYYAGGMKVCNLLGAYAARRNMLISMVPKESTETGKYPGAYVFPPERGISPDPDHMTTLDAAAAELRGAADDAAREAARARIAQALSELGGDRPVTGLDFSSLYPSLIMTYNLSPEKILLQEDEARQWAAAGRDIHPIEFPFNGRQVRGWSIRHRNEPADIGLYPSALIDLFNKRAEMKVALGVPGAVKELIEVINGRAKKSGVSEARALHDVLGEAEAELARTDAALAPGAPPPRISPGATLGEEMADLKRLNKNAREQVEGVRKLLAEAKVDDASRDEAAGAVQATLKRVYERVCFEWTGANTKQNALKVYMNTFYGEAGNSLSPFFLLELAGGVTSAGQYNIKAVADFVREKGFRIKYGDSVTGDTGLVVRRGGVISTARIDELVADDGWTPYGVKEAAVVPGLEIWQDGGFTAVHRVIRHACDKPIMRVLTHSGVVDCTTDHSLLRPDGSEVSPRDVHVGDELLHADDKQLIRELDCGDNRGIAPGEAWVMGLFAARGSCEVNQSGVTTRYHWAIVNVSGRQAELIASKLPFPTQVIPMPEADHFEVTPVGDIKGPTLRYREMFYNGRGKIRVPAEVISGDIAIARQFWDGYWEGKCIEPRGKMLCTGLWLIGRRLGLKLALAGLRGTEIVMVADGAPLTTMIRSVERLWASPKRQLVYDLETESHHFHVGPGNMVVHNTDSLYLIAPAKYFTECDAEYVEGRISREDWWSAMVRITMRALNQIRDEVNAFLRADNGSPYLKMAYEEVLYPVVFTGKKKYYGIPHLNEVNFHPKKLFIRGIDVVKQGQPGLAREIGGRIMWGSMALDNTRGLYRIVEDVLRDAVVNGAQWQFDHFVKTDAWKPDKQNYSVHRFIARMRARHAAEVAEAARVAAAGGRPKPYVYELPEPGERFAYVIVKTGSGAFNLYGLRAAPKKGDLMEFAHVARETGLEIDVAHYMVSNVIGLCARFINSDPAFQPPAALAARRSEKEIDAASQKEAKKALETFVKGLGGIDSKLLMRRGYAYRRAFAAAAGTIHGALVERVGAGAASVLHGDWIDFEILSGGEPPDDDDDSTPAAAAGGVELLWTNAGLFADALIARDAGAWNEAVGLELGFDANGADTGDAGRAERLYALIPPTGLRPATAAPRRPSPGAPRPVARRADKGLLVSAVGLASSLDRAEAAARAALAEALPAAGEIAARYEADLARLVSRARLDEHRGRDDLGAPEPELQRAADTEDVLLASISTDDRATLLNFRRLWFDAVGVQLARRRNADFVRHVEQLKARRLKIAPAPTGNERARLVAEAAAKFRPSGGVVDYY